MATSSDSQQTIFNNNQGKVAVQARQQIIYGNQYYQSVSRPIYTYSSSDINFRNYGNQYDESQLLQLLPAAAQAAFNSSDKQHHPLCLPNTRVDVLEQIMTWADKGDERCIF